MSIDFSRVTAMSDKYGVITQLELGGRVIWMLKSGGTKAVLQVEKITSNTYAGGTTYNNEQFILLDIYPKTNGTVKVTYGGLTKTITDTSGAEEPNAQQVFFGTLYGVSDSVTTPASGELTIEGDCYAYGHGYYDVGSKVKGATCCCITSIVSIGEISIIPANAFGSDNMSTDYSSFIDNHVDIPDTVLKIGSSAFLNCKSLQTVTIGKGITEIGERAFTSANSLDSQLTSVTMQGTTPPVLVASVDGSYINFGNRTFTNFKLSKITVPKGCGNAYKTATGWTTYADLIVEAS